MAQEATYPNTSRSKRKLRTSNTQMAPAFGVAPSMQMGVPGMVVPGTGSGDSRDDDEPADQRQDNSAAMPMPAMPQMPMPAMPQDSYLMPDEPAPAATPAPAPAPVKETPPPPAGPSAGGIFGVVAFLVLILGGIGYMIFMMEGAVFKAGRTAATALGCPHPPFRTKTFTEDFEVHQWIYDGVAMTVSAGSKIVAAPGAPTGAIPIMGITVTAELPKKLPFQFAINKPNVMRGPFFKTGDSIFDEELGVVTSNDPAAKKLLGDAGLRKSIRVLFQSDRSLPSVRGWLSEKEVTIDSGDRSIVRENCVNAAILAKVLSQKAESLGLFAPAASAAAAPAPLALPDANPAGPVMAFDGLTTEFPSWTMEGSCLFREEGIYFFVKSMSFVADKPGAGELLGAGFGQGGALLGALGEAAGAAFDESLRDGPDKPQGLYFGSARDVSERLGKALQEAPGINQCREFFVVPRADVQKVQMDEHGSLVVWTAARSFRLTGGEMEKAKGFLAFRGYHIAA